MADLRPVFKAAFDAATVVFQAREDTMLGEAMAAAEKAAIKLGVKLSPQVIKEIAGDACKVRTAAFSDFQLALQTYIDYK